MPVDNHLTHDHDPVDRARGVDLGDVGLPVHGVAITIGADGEERLVVLKYDVGPAYYWPESWSRIAPHEVT